MVQDLEESGVRRIDGDILVDQRFFDDNFIPPAFEQQPNEWALLPRAGERGRAQREHGDA